MLSRLQRTTHSPSILFGHYRLQLQPQRPPKFSDFPGSAWRGAIGHALKRTVCITQQRECKGCLLHASCLYPYLYDTPPNPQVGKMRRYQTAPHPYIVRPPLTPPAADATYPLDLILVGEASRHLPVILHAIRDAAGNGRGVAGGRLQALQLAQEITIGSDQWQPIWQPEQPLQPQPLTPLIVPPLPTGDITLTLQTPLRIKRDGRHVDAPNFRFADLFSNLLRRHSMLIEFHTPDTLEIDFRGLTAAAADVLNQ